MNFLKYRKINGLTQKRVAEYLGCSLSAYVKYEAEEREPSVCILSALADLYYISIDELVGHEIKLREQEQKDSSFLLPEVQTEESSIDDLAHLKYELNLEAAKQTGNHLLVNEVTTLINYADALLVRDIYAKIDFFLAVTDLGASELVRIFGVSRSGYYHWKQYGDVVKKRNEAIANLILQYELPALNSAGYSAVAAYLRTLDALPELRNISVSRVKRIMDEFEIISEDLRDKKNQVIFKVIGKYEASHEFVSPNKLYRTFDVDVSQCTYWCTDITEIETDEGKLYLCAVVDLCGRYLVGYAVSSSLDVRLVKRAIKMAKETARQFGAIKQETIIIHSDRGTQYRSTEYKKFAKKLDIDISMSKRHNPNDNACIESFFASLKCEYLYRYNLRSLDVAKQMIDRYIKFYNEVRVHQSCNNTPFAFWSAKVNLLKK